MRSSFLGMDLEDVVRYIDRDYGEKVRQETIDGWKDAKFAYGVRFHFKDSFSSGSLITKNETLMSFDNTQDDILVFANEDDASAFIDNVNKKAMEYYERYLNLKRTGNNDWDYDHTIKTFFNSIKGRKEQGPDSVYWRAFSSIKNENNSIIPGYKLEVVQVVLP